MFPSTATHGRRGCGGRRELIVVVEGALYACPWGALRSAPTPGTPGLSVAGDGEPLCERYALLAAPALRPLRHHRHMRARPHHDHGKFLGTLRKTNVKGNSETIHKNS